MSNPTTPDLLIIEHPNVKLVVHDVERLRKTVVHRRRWLFRPAQREALIEETHFFDELDSPAVLDALPDDIEGLHIIAAGFESREPLPQAWLRYLAALRVQSLRRTGPGFQRGPDESRAPRLITHRPHAGQPSEVLSIFPGPLIPTSMGAHQRAFGIVEALVRNGIPCDVLLADPRGRAAGHAVNVLSQLCSSVHVSRPGRSGLPLRLAARRGAEAGLRRALGITARAPRLFEERLHTAPPPPARLLLRGLLESGRYSTVIVNYAWMERIRASLPSELVSNYHWICDTHDVHFVRARTEAARDTRIGLSLPREQRLELETLRRFDKVLAISPSDAQALRAHLPSGRVLEVPTGFDYALQPPSLPHAQAPVCGFIGSAMDANVKAVQLLLREWWPSIIRRWPDASLRVAGRVSQTPEVRQTAAHLRGVELVGYVVSLRAFYATLHALLNPVVVQGGLNFKSVESVFAGRLLITTPMGTRCLGEPGLAEVATSGGDVVAILEREMSSADSFLDRRRGTAEAARTRFGDQTAYAPLVEHVRERLNASRRGHPPSGPRRVLIQVGDHYENWARVIGLAEQIRERGHHPIALVYETFGQNYFLSHGIDVTSLRTYADRTPSRVLQRALHRSRQMLRSSCGDVTPAFYRSFDLEDLTWSIRATGTGGGASASSQRASSLAHIDRAIHLCDVVRPDVLLVWNGYTGLTANVLRQAGAVRGLPTVYMERSLLPDAVFVDRQGVNGASSMAARSLGELNAFATSGRGARRCRNTLRAVAESEIEERRRSGPWRSASRIVFVPLQVESDTNLAFHSPDIRRMKDLVKSVWDEHHDERTAIVVRPHPEELAQIDLPILPGVYIDARGDLDTWLEVADLIVTINSTVGLTALTRGRTVSAIGCSIYSDKGLTSGVSPDPAAVDTLLNYMFDVHTATEADFPRELESLLPARDTQPWEPVYRGLASVVEWWTQWREFADEVRAHAERSGSLHLHSYIPRAETLDLTYRKLRVPLTDKWLERRARTVFSLRDEVSIRVHHHRPRTDIAGSSADRVVVAPRPDARKGYVLDKYLAPWAPEAAGSRS